MLNTQKLAIEHTPTISCNSNSSHIVLHCQLVLLLDKKHICCFTTSESPAEDLPSIVAARMTHAKQISPGNRWQGMVLARNPVCGDIRLVSVIHD